jgi:DnaJ-class molecular chaperone
MEKLKDYYKILGISENASQDEVKKAYRKLAKQYHPDTHAGEKKAEERFKEISEAYAVLNNPEKRKQYDMMRKNPFAGAGGQGGFDFSNFANQGSGGFRMNFSGAEGGVGSLDDLLGDLFGFGKKRGKQRSNRYDDMFRGSRTRQANRGADIQAQVTVPFDLAVKGGETFVQIPSGKRMKIKIPPGSEEGKKMKLSGQGSPAPAGGTAGDLYIVLHITPSSKFERKGRDIYTSEKISLADAILGTEIEVTTVAGKKIKLKIPAGTDSGKMFRLRGMGVKATDGVGDFYVRIDIQTPKNLSSAQKREFKEWARKAGVLN